MRWIRLVVPGVKVRRQALAHANGGSQHSRELPRRARASPRRRHTPTPLIAPDPKQLGRAYHVGLPPMIQCHCNCNCRATTRGPHLHGEAHESKAL